MSSWETKSRQNRLTNDGSQSASAKVRANTRNTLVRQLADQANDTVLDRLQISQGNRFYFYRWQGQPPVPPEVIVRNSANMHLIPASATVARALEQARPGAVVTLRGWLVDVSAPDGWQWRSSRTRTDSGAGACEVIWVEDVELGGSGV